MREAPPPPLKACVLEEGGIGVFPRRHGQDICAELGLAPITGADVEPGTAGFRRSRRKSFLVSWRVALTSKRPPP
jgi:hypothetical protein